MARVTVAAWVPSMSVSLTPVTVTVWAVVDDHVRGWGLVEHDGERVGVAGGGCRGDRGSLGHGDRTAGLNHREAGTVIVADPDGHDGVGCRVEAVVRRGVDDGQGDC